MHAFLFQLREVQLHPIKLLKTAYNPIDNLWCSCPSVNKPVQLNRCIQILPIYNGLCASMLTALTTTIALNYRNIRLARMICQLVSCVSILRGHWHPVMCRCYEVTMFLKRCHNTQSRLSLEKYSLQLVRFEEEWEKMCNCALAMCRQEV